MLIIIDWVGNAAGWRAAITGRAIGTMPLTDVPTIVSVERAFVDLFPQALAHIVNIELVAARPKSDTKWVA